MCVCVCVYVCVCVCVCVCLGMTPYLLSYCIQSQAVLTWNTSEKHRNVLFSKGHTISLHGFGFDTLCSSSIQPPPSPPPPTPPTTTPSQQLQRPLADTVVLCMVHVRLSYRIMVGNRECRDPVVVSEYQINCTLESGT